MQDEKVVIIENEQGNKATPSFVAFTEEGLKIGETAKNQAARNPKNTVFNAKRLIGRKMKYKIVSGYSTKEFGGKICKHLRGCPFKVEPDKDGRPMIEVNKVASKKSYAGGISDMIFGKMN